MNFDKGYIICAFKKNVYAHGIKLLRPFLRSHMFLHEHSQIIVGVSKPRKIKWACRVAHKNVYKGLIRKPEVMRTLSRNRRI